MSKFGWSYPPGAAGDPFAPYNAVDPPCEVCGGAIDAAVDDGGCMCPDCPVCGCVGDPDCYRAHGLARTPAQDAGRARLVAEHEAQAEADRAEAAYWADPQRRVENAELDAMYREGWRNDRGGSRRPHTGADMTDIERRIVDAAERFMNARISTAEHVEARNALAEAIRARAVTNAAAPIAPPEVERANVLATPPKGNR